MGKAMELMDGGVWGEERESKPHAHCAPSCTMLGAWFTLTLVTAAS